MDRKTRKLMRQNTAHHHSASLERLYLPRGEGGRGMTMIGFEWEREAVASTLYLARCTDPQVRGAMAMQNFYGSRQVQLSPEGSGSARQV